MPGYDGVEFTSDLASLHPCMPIVGMSGADEMLRRTVECLLRVRGVSCVLSKPLQAGHLLHRLIALLSGSLLPAAEIAAG
jgi:CheY-like chemotaxis protein